MDNSPNSLVLATGNPGKTGELKDLFRDVPLELKSLRDFERIVDVEETGSTFRENAKLKARGFAMQTGQLSLADDSGLEIEALGNAPGVHSARFAGTAGYEVKIPKLLTMLDETGDTVRRARFVCVMALASSDGRIVYNAKGICTGSIADSPRGNHGFGYDPIFVPDGFDLTFGELDDDVKRSISHRASAAALIIRYLLDFIAV
ncbi:MAG: RdgB/HAM1 family non-canonical purine NTP pyrophosphatase [Acidobacteriota bacterium]